MVGVHIILFYFVKLHFQGSGMFLKTRKPGVKVILADPPVRYCILCQAITK